MLRIVTACALVIWGCRYPDFQLRPDSDIDRFGTDGSIDGSIDGGGGDANLLDASIDAPDAGAPECPRYQHTLTFDNSGQSETLMDFPVLVKLDDTRIDYGLIQDEGQDLRFSDDTGAELAYEIERWDETGTSYVWVNVPEISASSSLDHILMSYGDPMAPSGEDVDATWDANYVAVWHLHDDVNDSTATGNHATNNGSISSPGVIASGQQFDGVSTYIGLAGNASIDDLSRFTFAMWIHPSDVDRYEYLISKSAATKELHIFQGLLEGQVSYSTSTDARSSFDGVSENQWHFVVMTFDDAGTQSVRLFVDGSEVTYSSQTAGQGTIDSDQGGNLELGRSTVGNLYFVGDMDEVRISTIPRSPAWIRAQHLSMTDNFVTFGPQQVIDDCK